MLKLLAVLSIIVVFMTIFVAVQDERASEQRKHQSTNALKHSKDSVVAEPNKKQAEHDSYDPEWDLPRWYGFFRWPSGITTWAIILTLAALIEQTRHSAKAAEVALEQIKIANATLILQFRPRITVREFVLQGNPFGYGGLGGGRFTFTNVGGSRATVQAVFAESYVIQGNNLPIQIDGEPQPIGGREILYPGQTSFHHFRLRKPLDDDSSDAIRLGNSSLYVLGWIEYVDDLKFYRVTRFARRYDRRRHRFFAIKDPEHENAD